MTESTLAPESKPLDRSPGNDGPASEGAHDTSDKVTENGDSLTSKIKQAKDFAKYHKFSD